MSKIVELYVKELTREGSTMTINDVPKKLRKQVEDAIAALEAAANAGTAEGGAGPSRGFYSKSQERRSVKCWYVCMQARSSWAASPRTTSPRS